MTRPGQRHHLPPAGPRCGAPTLGRDCYPWKHREGLVVSIGQGSSRTSSVAMSLAECITVSN